jgi:hypothetical protein
LINYYSTTAKIYSAPKILYSSQSNFTSSPEYCPERTLSPILTGIGFQSLPGQTSITSYINGLSFDEVSGI